LCPGWEEREDGGMRYRRCSFRRFAAVAVVILASLLPGTGIGASRGGTPAAGPRWTRGGDLESYGEIVTSGADFLVGGAAVLSTVGVTGGTPSVGRRTATAGTQPFLVSAGGYLYAGDQEHGITVFDLSVSPTAVWSVGR